MDWIPKTLENIRQVGFYPVVVIACEKHPSDVKDRLPVCHQVFLRLALDFFKLLSSITEVAVSLVRRSIRAPLFFFIFFFFFLLLSSQCKPRGL